MQMADNCFNYLPPLTMDDYFPQMNLSETTITKSIDHHQQSNLGCDKFKDYVKGAVMFEDIFDLCSTRGTSINLPLAD